MLEARPRGGPLGLPYTPKNLERFQMVVQRLVLIHPRELEIPTVKDINPVASMKALLEDTEKVVQNAEVEKDGKEDENVPEHVAKIQAKFSRQMSQKTFNFRSTIMVYSCF